MVQTPPTCGVDFTQSEDIIIILDCAKSAYFRDLPPNRISVIASAVNIFAEKRLEASKRDRYFLIEANHQVTEGFADLIDDPRQIAQQIASLIPQPTILSSEPRLSEALVIALEWHIKTFKTVGNKTLRIVIVGDGNVALSKENIVDLTRKVAARIGVYVDAIKIGTEHSPHIFKTLAEVTKGSYYLVTTPEELYAAFQAISEKKEVLKPKYVPTSPEIPKQKSFLEVLAADMVEVDDVKADTKCQICFCVEPKADLRLCPNCKKVLHQTCAGKWAEHQNLGFPNVFRCPFCFFLLKVPRNCVDFNKSMQNFQDLKEKYQEAFTSSGKCSEEKSRFESIFDEEMALAARREILAGWMRDKMPGASKYQIDPIVDEILHAEKASDLDAYLRYLRDIKGIDTRDFPAQ